MPAHQLLELLHQRRVPYAIIRRPPAVPAPESAASAPLPGQALAKTIPVMLDGQLALAVLPASDRLDIERLRAAAGAGLRATEPGGQPGPALAHGMAAGHRREDRGACIRAGRAASAASSMTRGRRSLKAGDSASKPPWRRDRAAHDSSMRDDRGLPAVQARPGVRRPSSV
jgi:hypothetical protein